MQFLFLNLLLTGFTAQAVDLHQYRFDQVARPRPIAQLTSEDRDSLKALHSNDIRFLFVAPCPEKPSTQCLWAKVNTLFNGQLVWEKGEKQITLSHLRDPELKFTRTELFVPLCEDDCPGVTVNGHTTRVTHWLTLRDDLGEDLPPIPFVWIGVSPENQMIVNADYHLAYTASRKKRVQLFYEDLQAKPTTPGFYAIIGYHWLDGSLSNHHFTAIKHNTEVETYTGTTQAAVFSDANPIPRMTKMQGYTITLDPTGGPVTLTRLQLYGEEKGAALKGLLAPVGERH